ncbi:hypothetical protein FB451DRAFT_1178033 [Mycena latifolia]|nr:hypothetical protein FB451DRAFT_1178033 [Mycena latifolia]
MTPVRLSSCVSPPWRPDAVGGGSAPDLRCSHRHNIRLDLGKTCASAGHHTHPYIPAPLFCKTFLGSIWACTDLSVVARCIRPPPGLVSSASRERRYPRCAELDKPVLRVSLFHTPAPLHIRISILRMYQSACNARSYVRFFHAVYTRRTPAADADAVHVPRGGVSGPLARGISLLVFPHARYGVTNAGGYTARPAGPVGRVAHRLRAARIRATQGAIGRLSLECAHSPDILLLPNDTHARAAPARVLGWLSQRTLDGLDHYLQALGSKWGPSSKGSDKQIIRVTEGVPIQSERSPRY